MIELIRDLYAHPEWADAQHWRTILASPAALGNDGLRQVLFHIHGVQQVWLARWQGADLGFSKPEDYPLTLNLYPFAKACHSALRAYLSLRSEADLPAAVTYRNIAGETFSQPLRDLLLHLPYHSQYHRGQTARALVALGSHAPATDLVVWQRAGRAQAEWP